MTLKHILLTFAIALVPAFIHADGVDDEHFLDSVEHPTQDLIMQKLQKKPWTLDKYVTLPKFGGYIIANYKYDSSKGKSNTFDFRNIRFYVDGTVFRDFKYRVQMEISGNPGGSGKGVRVIDAFIDWTHFKEFGVKLGEYKRCFTFENPMNPWDICGGEYTQLTRNMAGMSTELYPGNIASGGRDVGLQLHGNLIHNKAKGFSYLHYQAGVYNGQGINQKDADKEKDWIGTVQVQPVKHWFIGVFGWHGSYYGLNGGSNKPQYSQYFSRWAVGTTYEGEKLSVRAEYARNHNTYPDKVVADGWNLIASYNVWRWIKPFVRYDAYRSDAATWKTLNTIYGVGVNLKPHKNLMLQLQYNYIHNNATVVDKDYHQIWTMAYIRF